MKTQNSFIKGALILVIGILNTIGLGVIVPSVKAFSEKIEAKKSLNLVGYLPLVVGIILLIINYTGGIKPEDKVYIEDQLEVIKVDTLKVDTLVKIDTLK